MLFNFDLYPLPNLNIVEKISYADLKTKLLTLIKAIDSSIVLKESSKEMVLLEAFAYELIHRDAMFNERIKQTLPIYATGGNLDIACKNFYGTERLTAETDQAFLSRSFFSLEQSSTAGAEWSYIYHTKTVSVFVRDVKAYSPTPGTVEIIWRSKISDDELLKLKKTRAEFAVFLQNNIVSTLNNPKLRPLCEVQIVKEATEIEVSIVATLKTIYPSENFEIATKVKKEIEKYFDNVKIGEEIRVSKLISLLHVEGVVEVVLSEPVNSIVVSSRSVAVLKKLTTIQIESVDE